MNYQLLMNHSFQSINDSNHRQSKESIDFFVDEIVKANEQQKSRIIYNSSNFTERATNIKPFEIKPISCNASLMQEIKSNLKSELNSSLYLQQDDAQTLSLRGNSENRVGRLKNEEDNGKCSLLNNLSLSPSNLDIKSGYNNLEVIQSEVISIHKQNFLKQNKDSIDYNIFTNTANRIASMSTKVTQPFKNYKMQVADKCKQSDSLNEEHQAFKLKSSKELKNSKYMLTDKAVYFPDESSSKEQIIFERSDYLETKKTLRILSDPMKSLNFASEIGKSEQYLDLPTNEAKEEVKIEDYAIIYHNIQKLKQDNSYLLKKNSKLSAKLQNLYEDYKTICSELESEKLKRNAVRNLI